MTTPGTHTHTAKKKKENKCDGTSGRNLSTTNANEGQIEK